MHIAVASGHWCGAKRPLCALSGHHVWDIKIVEKDMPRKALYMSLTHERLLLPRQNGRYAAWFAAFALNSCVIEAHVKSIVEYRSTILRGGRCRRNVAADDRISGNSIPQNAEDWGQPRLHNFIPPKVIAISVNAPII